ncbi:hypothetical protein AUP68_04285 [Ilyonectria robusta]
MLFATAIAVLGLVSSSTAAPAPTVLSADDIIVLKTDGSTEIMKAADFEALESKSSAPTSFGLRDATDAKLVRRSCEDSSTEIQVLSDEEFLNWDVAISPVVSSVGGTWTTSQTQTLTFTVPDGKHGVIVSEPYVRRVQGFMLEGCSDDWKKTSFMSDTYSSQSYGDMQWVRGVIRLCSSDTYPIPYCVGTGQHE